MLHSSPLVDPRTPRQGGFTIIELMIAVVVVGILAAIALPSYFESVRKSRRAEAVSRLTEVMQAQERWRSNNTTYATREQLGIPATVDGGYYRLSVTVTASGYQAIAESLQADERCTSLRFELDGANLNYTSTGSAPGTGPHNYCWNR